jgi:hypothetical protein
METKPTTERGKNANKHRALRNVSQLSREEGKKGHKKKQPSTNLEAKPTTHATTKN